MGRLLVFMLLVFGSVSSFGSSKEQIQVNLQEAENEEADLYMKLKKSMGEPMAMVRKKPSRRMVAASSSGSVEYQVRLIRVARVQGRR